MTRQSSTPTSGREQKCFLFFLLRKVSFWFSQGGEAPSDAEGSLPSIHSRISPKIPQILPIDSAIEPKKASGAKLKLPRKDAGYDELSDFFDQHEGFDLLDRGIVEIDSDHEDLERMLIEYWNQPNTKQLNIRIPPAAKRMIERLAKRKTLEVSTLVRMWVIDSMRREASQP